jgi:prepilin-type processing-associated H-X9-DG protein
MPPAMNWFPAFNVKGGSGVGPLFFHMLPWVDQQNLYAQSRRVSSSPHLDYYDYQVGVCINQLPLFDCPGDPTLPSVGGARGAVPYAASSYAANFLVFGNVNAAFRYVDPSGKPSLVRSFPDGTSRTILIGEKYAVCSITADRNIGGKAREGGSHFAYWGNDAYAPFFALYDPKWTDADAIGAASLFQVRPSPAAGACSPSRASTGHSSGMNAGMADGSVQTLSQGISGAVWWALVTPAGGEVQE